MGTNYLIAHSTSTAVIRLPFEINVGEFVIELSYETTGD